MRTESSLPSRRVG